MDVEVLDKTHAWFAIKTEAWFGYFAVSAMIPSTRESL
jgi:hypothetical protein